MNPRTETTTTAWTGEIEFKEEEARWLNYREAVRLTYRRLVREPGATKKEYCPEWLA